MERMAHSDDESFHGFLAVLKLAPAVGRDDPDPSLRIQSGCKACHQERSLLVRQAGRADYVPPEFDPGRRAVDVLPARPPGSGSLELQLSRWQGELVGDGEFAR